ncbi:LytTR family transcriptional regulator DNA-binding domain-containing protein [Arcicella aquatica]|uniref:LytTR family transcriptional regulator DNA-binding domain-containing protein n=1 Tax=Arcicella aquatica TaxID=217141 RepID=A0ABU5QTF8_9BACT|nr:LytTR family transcriptional regulator DNA-binding domain-containing protein [Arcicella aquatica]MEA5259990.1 LytTR family transcriptional regulator DNA-binding domain-containing protein [Arcicella aquatica]
MQFKTILIDDEPISISRMRRLLNDYNDTFDIIGEALNGQEGLEIIEELKPDLIFLDIEMPILSGFEMLAKLTYMPIVVFVTAFDQFAIKAFEENSVDYLLKPIEKSRLDRTVLKLQKLTANQSVKLSSESLQTISELIKPKKEIHSISVRNGDKILIIAFHEISHFQADEKYVFLNTVEGKQYITNHTIVNLTEKLPDSFIRISRSCIVNATRIKELEKHFNGKYLVVMQDQKRSKLETGISFHDNLKRLMEI